MSLLYYNKLPKHQVTFLMFSYLVSIRFIETADAWYQRTILPKNNETWDPIQWKRVAQSTTLNQVDSFTFSSPMSRKSILLLKEEQAVVEVEVEVEVQKSLSIQRES